MEKGSGSKKKAQREEEYSIAIDVNTAFDEDELKYFIIKKFKERKGKEPSIQQQAVYSKMLVLLLESSEDMKGLLDLNGMQYNGQAMLISRFFWEKYTEAFGDLKKYFKEHYNGGKYDLSGMLFSFKSLNRNFFGDINFVLFSLGVISRRFNRPVIELNFSKNDLHKVGFLTNITKYFPQIRKLDLSKNQLDQTDKISELFPAITVIYNQIVFNENNEAESTQFPDTLIPPATSAPQFIPSFMPEEQPQQRPRNSNGSEIYDDGSLNEISGFLDYFLATSEASQEEIHTCYKSDAVFALVFGTIYPDHPLSSLKQRNQNMVYSRDGVTKGDHSIAKRLTEVFPNGFKADVEHKMSELVEDLFFHAQLKGTVDVSGNDVRFLRDFVIQGIDGQLLISNDILYLM